MSKRLVVLVVAVLSACAGPVEEPTRTLEAPLSQCELALPLGVTGVLALSDGVVFAREAEVLRARGHGCALEVAAPLAAGRLEAVDDLGRVYVRATEALRAAHFPDTFGDTVARIDPSGAVTPIVSAGRGIWSFSVSPRGETVAVTACGPEGVLTVPDLEPVLPDWRALPGDLSLSVLSDARTVWSVRTDGCERGWCEGMELVRTTPEGHTVVAEVGSGTLSSVRLSRCGDAVCTFSSTRLTRWDASGAVLQELELGELGLSESAFLQAVSGNDLGLYLTVLDPTLRVLFVPVTVAGHAR